MRPARLMAPLYEVGSWGWGAVVGLGLGWGVGGRRGGGGWGEEVADPGCGQS